MIGFTKNEIAALLHLADGEQHEDTPTTISKPQYYTALQRLKNRGMAYVAFIEGGEAECAMLTMSGQSAVDDLKQVREYLLSRILKEKSLTKDQYDLLKQAEQGNVDYNASNILPREFKNLVFNPLYHKKLVYAAPGSKMTEVVITRQGRQLLEEIEYEVNIRISQDNNEPPFMRDNEDSTAIKLPTATEEYLKINDENNTVNELRKQKAQLEIENSELKDKIQELEDARRAPIEEQTIIEHGQGKNKKHYHTTAKQCADIVKKYKLLEKFQANTIEEMLSEITGMSATSFHRHMR